jgi:hypothetical protein
MSCTIYSGKQRKRRENDRRGSGEGEERRGREVKR